MAKKSQPSPTVIIAVVAVIILAIGALSFINYTNQSPQGNVQGAQSDNNTSSNTADIQKAQIDQDFDINTFDTSGNPSQQTVTMSIKSAEKTPEILVKGNPATAKNGSRFLVLNVDLTNNTTDRLITTPLNLVRLVINDQKRAPEIYTEEIPQIKGSVVVEPDSSKLTRIGFVLPVDVVDSPKQLQIGEVETEEKQFIEIDL
jgi:uncharacterized protein YxeA